MLCLWRIYYGLTTNLVFVGLVNGTPSLLLTMSLSWKLSSAKTIAFFLFGACGRKGTWESLLFRDDLVFGFCFRRTCWIASVWSYNNFLFLVFQYPHRLNCEAHYIFWSLLDSLSDYLCFKLIILIFDICSIVNWACWHRHYLCISYGNIVSAKTRLVVLKDLVWFLIVMR